MNLSPEEKEVGKQNFNEAVGTTRRDFLKGTVLAGAATGTSLGAMYFGYDATVENPVRVGVIGTGDEGGVLIGALNPDFIEVKAIADIRPYSLHRAWHGDWYSPGAREARKGLMEVYGWKSEGEAREKVAVFERYQDLVDNAADLDIEGVIIALPLHLHDAAAIYAMRNGLHVLTEKLMAHSVHQCKEMARVAAASQDPNGNPIILATGHQRHYSVLYDNAVDQIRRGLIGDIHHIRAQWHRANMPGSDSWQPPLPTEKISAEALANEIRAARKISKAAEEQVREKYELLDELYSWQRVVDGNHPTVQPKGDELLTWQKKLAQKKAQLEDFVLKDVVEQYGYQAKTLANGYQRSPLEELIRWRLWDRTGGGLMAELGSHQLDAASIFITAQRADGKKVRPLSVASVGGRHIFPLDRDVNDHVYAIFEFPGNEYYKEGSTTEVADPNKKIVVTYSSINGNGFGGWGEVVLGTDGTLILEREQDVMLYKGSSTTTRVSVKEADGKAAMDTYETGGGAAAVAQAATPTNISRGYTEEIEHWAWCIRNPDPQNQPRCKPEVALADAVIALTTNIAMRENRHIEFDPAWFDIDDDATPEGQSPRPADDIA